jgi:hypothetical protein
MPVWTRRYRVRPRKSRSAEGTLPDAKVVEHDLRDGPVATQVHVFHRIDTELRGSEWRGVFHRFASERIIFVPGEIADLRRLRFELRLRVAYGLQATRAGWLRNRAAFGALWRETHVATTVRFHDLDGWVLYPRT